MSDEKLDKIFSTLGEIKTSVAVIVNEMQTMNNRGCKASMDKIEIIEKEISTTKGIAVGGGAIGTIIATGISIWSYLRGQ